MLLVLTGFYILQGLINTNAAPLSFIFPRQTNTGVPHPQECVCPDSRSEWDIVQSCLVTIIACSWVSVHPNIPGPGESWLRKALRKLELMFWSIISPELIIYWASMQWLAAFHLARKYNKVKWTRTHVYFLQMGGFILYDGNRPMGVICPEKFDELLSKEKIAMPTTTKEEIWDRSKGDGLSKMLVIVQTTWFATQCIARRVQGLIITELELVTLAFTAFNIVVYIFWWDKPLNVETTVPVYLLRPTPLEIPRSAEALEAESDGNVVITPRDDGPGGHETTNVNGTNIELENLLQPSEQPTNHPSEHVDLADLFLQAGKLVTGVLFRWPTTGIMTVVYRMHDILGGDSVRVVEGDMRVKTFYAYDAGAFIQTRDVLVSFFALPFVGITFGAIHCTAWNFLFPSLIEANIWRVSSAIITGVPALGLVVLLLSKLDEFCKGKNVAVRLYFRGVAYLTAVMLPFYVFARIALLVVALISLRDLPPGALAVVKWTSFIPHV